MYGNVANFLFFIFYLFFYKIKIKNIFVFYLFLNFLKIKICLLTKLLSFICGGGGGHSWRSVREVALVAAMVKTEIMEEIMAVETWRRGGVRGKWGS